MKQNNTIEKIKFSAAVVWYLAPWWIAIVAVAITIYASRYLTA